VRHRASIGFNSHAPEHKRPTLAGRRDRVEPVKVKAVPNAARGREVVLSHPPTIVKRFWSVPRGAARYRPGGFHHALLIGLKRGDPNREASLEVVEWLSFAPEMN
jgi:hypothetical protein